MSARPRLTAHALHVISPTTLLAIRRVLKKALLGSVMRQEREDHVQEVVARMLAVRNPPETEEECRALGIKITENLAVDVLRSKTSRRRCNLGPTGEADHRAAPAEDPTSRLAAKQQLEFVAEQREAGTISARQEEILHEVADGAPHGAIATTMHVSRKTVKNEVAAARKALREVWAARLSIRLSVMLSVGLLVLLLRSVVALHPEPRVAKDEPEKPPVPKVPDPPAPDARAAELRRAALHACDLDDWKPCLEGLDQAKALDPAGDARPEVQAARARAAGAHTKPAKRAPAAPAPRAHGRVAGEKGWL